MFSERSGIVNIALEGKMIIGAFAGTFFIHHFQESISGQPLLIIALILGMLAGMLVSLLHAYAAINLKANQIISGVAINMFAPAFAVYIARMVTGSQNVMFNNAQFRIDSVPFFGAIPFIGPMFFQGVFITTLLAVIILVVSAFVLYKTKFGLRLRACGEHPQAADSVGISVTKIRYSGVLISGALAGIGGVAYIIPISIVFDSTVAGYGFLALAVLIFGAWRPKKILFGAVFFGLMQAVSINPAVIPVIGGLGIHVNFFRMIPFIATLVVLAFSSKKSQAPKAVGQPYDKGGR
jgi:simple sugar transport system permease protein